jgi:hypothetical protein
MTTGVFSRARAGAVSAIKAHKLRDPMPRVK